MGDTYKGVVQKGTKRGSELGFPTANISLDHASISGIYAALVRVDGKEYRAAVYADQNRKLLEAHLVGENPTLYGKGIEIQLLKKIREDRKFESDEVLRAQIARDVRKIQEFFKQYT